MEYGKLVNGQLIFALESEPRCATDGELVGNHYMHYFTDSELRAMGYKEIVYEEIPVYNEETQDVSFLYTETETQIIESVIIIDKVI